MHYWTDGQRHNLSSLSDNEIHALLKPFHHASTEHVFCAYQRTDALDSRLPMYVRQNRSTSLSLARVATQQEDYRSPASAPAATAATDADGWPALDAPWNDETP